MNWNHVNETITTIRSQFNRKLKQGPAALASCDQDEMIIKDYIQKMGINLDEITDRDLYMILSAVNLIWWMATKTLQNDQFDEDDFRAVISASSTAGWGFLYLTRKDWLKDES